MSIRAQALSGIRWAGIASLVRTAVQLAQLFVLTKLLSPADFGNMAVVLAIVTFLQMFSDMGISNGIIHRRTISEEQLSSLYWLNVAAGGVMALLLWAAGPWVAQFYGQAVLQPLLFLAALYLVISATWQQLRVIAEKELRFARLAGIEIAASLTTLVVSALLAWHGEGVYSMIWGVLAGSLVAALLAWIVLAQGWTPRPRLRLAEVREFLDFGAYMMANNLASTLFTHVDILLGARILDAHAIGLYSLPKNLSTQITSSINPIITRVGLPVMAKSQDDVLLLRRIYLQAIRMTAAANFPVFVALGLFAPEVVRLIFGSQWHEAIPLMQAFACWALIRATGNPVGSLLMARGRADISFKWTVAWLLVIAPAAWAGSQFGPLGLALALTAVAFVGLVPNWYFLVRPLCGAGFIEYFRELVPPLIYALLAGAIAYAAASPVTADLPRLALGLGAGTVVYLSLSLTLDRAWRNAILELLGFR